MSTVTPVMAEPPVAARAGADLRAARERLGWSLSDVAFELRIRKPHLEALEEGRLSMLPGNAYALGFVRTYARAIGLDAEETVRRFKTEAGEFNRRTELVFPVPMPDRGLPAGAIVLLSLVLAIGAYVGWYRLSAEGRLPAEAVTAIPERLAPLAEQALPPPPNTATADPAAAVPVRPAASPDQAPAPGPLAAVPQPMSVSPGSAIAAPAPAQPQPSTALASVAPLVPAPLVAAPAADESRVLIHANAASWVMVKDKSGAILLNKTLKTGEVWPVPPRTDLILTTGNAGGTDLIVDGVVAPSLGSSGTVRRDLPLDPDAIKDGKLAGAVAPQLASSRPRS
jgi:cytoskeleton protein RodZ